MFRSSRKSVILGMQSSSFFVLLFIFTANLIFITNSAVTHGQPHHHKRSPSPNKEREEDGAFSPRDKHHSGGSDHVSDFDHEAILGMFHA